MVALPTASDTPFPFTENAPALYREQVKYNALRYADVRHYKQPHQLFILIYSKCFR